MKYEYPPATEMNVVNQIRTSSIGMYHISNGKLFIRIRTIVIICRNDDALLCRQHAAAIDNDISQYHKDAADKRDQMLVRKDEQHHVDQKLVGDRIGEFAERRDQIVLSGDIAVKIIGERCDGK